MTALSSLPVNFNGKRGVHGYEVMKYWSFPAVICELTLARFILETDYPSRSIIRLTDHPSKYEHKTNYPDELRKKIVRLIIRLCINAGKQTDHPSRRATRTNSSEQTNYAHSSLDG